MLLFFSNQEAPFVVHLEGEQLMNPCASSLSDCEEK